MKEIIADLIKIGYTFNAAVRLYEFYKKSGKLNDLKEYLKIKQEV